MAEDFHDIKITGVIVEDVSTPKNDGTEGSGLYSVPFQLSRKAPPEWAQAFEDAWDHPKTFTTMHRPRICNVRGDRVVLTKTTIDEVEKTHMQTLRLAQEAANERTRALRRKMARQEEERERQETKHQRHVREVAERLEFDEDGG